MSSFEVELFYGDGNVCKFYTVRYNYDEDDALSETDKFFEINDNNELVDSCGEEEIIL